MNIKEQWYYFKYGVQNLIKWFHIVWNDRDWDNHYIYEVLKFKLINQAKYIGNHNIHTRAKRDAEIMSLCVKLIQRCQDDYYDSECMDYQVTEWHCEENDSCKSKLISENFDDYFKKYPLQYKKVMSGEISMFKKPIKDLSKQRVAREIAHNNQERCRRLLFKLLERNIEKWWD